jgi:hypothetical protein
MTRRAAETVRWSSELKESGVDEAFASDRKLERARAMYFSR